VLGAILAISAVSTDAAGVGLLTAYALGLGVPFLVAALLADRAARVIAKWRRFGAGLQIAGGAVLVALGVAMMTGQLAVASTWLLEHVPALGTIG